MTTAPLGSPGSGPLASGKGHRDENFPVASWLLRPAARAPIMAFYRFARAADDVADHARAEPEEKYRRLAALRAGLDGAAALDGSVAQAHDGAPAVALHSAMAERGIDPAHAHDLLAAFTQDVAVHRYASWTALIDYCRLSAMPVGRYVLDVHGESRATWPGNDALCAALQIVNHLQDCGKDYRQLDRVYLPLDLLAEHGARVDDLGRDRATPALLAAIRDAAARSKDLLATSRGFARQINDRRLAAEVRVIQALAEDLCARLLHADPLADRVHHGKLAAARIAIGAVIRRDAR